MEDLANRLKKWNLTGLILKKEELNNGAVKSVIDEIDEGNPIYLIASPEVLISTEMRKLLRNITIHQIHVDEVHMAVLWAEDFRTAFSAISNIRMFSDCCLAVFTATFKEQMMNQMIKNTGLDKKNLAIVTSSPDRPEIFIELQLRGKKFEDDFEFLRKEVEDMGVLTPKTLCFVNTIDKTSDLNVTFRGMLNDKGRVMKNGELYDYISDHYSASTEPLSHDRILDTFADPEACLRILFATVSYGMGIDNKTIRRVIMYDMETDPLLLFQKIGRMSRDGTPGKAILYSSSLTYGRLLKKKGECIRRAILSTLMGYDKASESKEKIACICNLGKLCNCDKCRCCSNCKVKCPCQKSSVNYIEDMEVEESCSSASEPEFY